jgi:hypothetical protein
MLVSNYQKKEGMFAVSHVCTISGRLTYIAAPTMALLHD